MNLLPESTSRWGYDREVLRARCASYALSIKEGRQKRPLQQRVIAVVQRGNAVSRLDLCFVDDLVSLLIYELELQDQVRAASMQKLLAEHTYQFTFRGETIRATTVVTYLGCQVESQGNTRAEAQMRVIKARKAQTRYSCGLWAPRSIG